MPKLDSSFRWNDGAVGSRWMRSEHGPASRPWRPLGRRVQLSEKVLSVCIRAAVRAIRVQTLLWLSLAKPRYRRSDAHKQGFNTGHVLRHHYWDLLTRFSGAISRRTHLLTSHLNILATTGGDQNRQAVLVEAADIAPRFHPLTDYSPAQTFVRSGGGSWVRAWWVRCRYAGGAGGRPGGAYTGSRGRAGTPG